ncbi:HD-GYP domain-containing protein [Clostridium sp. Cult3]|uniref:HD-GYP domain-containing protein n=1 Tax=Clostridium sp. Cult3 TaxID=2079004 RepID=UPI001F22AF0B|nr:HD-GYP domain-containing protein [Clostridium sp. Cult3]MCF6459499.1 hypothetical protein [Clostridium sp. Cult3]
MSVQLEFNSSRWIKCQSNTVEKELEKRQKRISQVLDYDICASVIFNECRNIAITKSIYTRDANFSKEILPNMIFFQKNSKNKLNELVNNKSIVQNRHTGDRCFLIEEVKSEVFIPIFNPRGNTMTLIGCIYLASYEDKSFPSELLLEDDGLNEQISGISKLLNLSLVEYEQLSNAMGMINVLTEILKHKDHFLPNHSYNVANWCKEIGMELGLSHEELDKLYLAGLLHDVGKTMIDYNILNKPGKLTEEEYKIIKNHPIDSYIISKHLLGHIPKLRDIPKIVRHHHECYDGKGYPDGLKGDEVPFYSYIIGISDAIDAMLSNRAYKKAMPLNAVISELYKNKGVQFHPELVDIMAEKLTKAAKQLKETLYNPIGLSSLIISSKEDILIIEGTLVKLENIYIFKPLEESKVEGIELSKAVDVEMVVKGLNSLQHFEAKVEDFEDNTFYISNLQLIPSSNTFNLIWNLEGILYHPVSNKKVPIEIMRIGGDALSFAIYGDIAKGIPYEETIKVKVLFEDQDIDVSGNIMKAYNFGPYKYFDLAYTNIPDFKRDMIFRQLFRKQIQLRKAIAEYKY